MKTGYFMPVLHAHLPFVRHPEHEEFLEEYWLFEAISETYLPLLRVFRGLEEDKVPFKLTMSISPTLATMLRDDLLLSRYERHLDRLIELAEREVARTSGDPLFEPVAQLYRDLFLENRHDFAVRYERDVLHGFDYYHKRGHIEMITTPATHAFLPLYENYPYATQAQVDTAVKSHAESFGKEPRGMWLPECGYYPGLEEILKDNRISYFFTAAHGLLYAENAPSRGVFAPAEANGTYAFARDVSLANAVWSAEEGYPGDFVYRDFYRDIGYDLPLEYLASSLPMGRVRTSTGLKYYAITGNTEEKRPYHPRIAKSKTVEHADNFVYRLLRRIDKATPLMDIPPVVVCPFDAELFGHWWFEGPWWLDMLYRDLAEVPDRVEVVTPTMYLKRHPDQEKVQPVFSSWGSKGYAEVWLDGSNDWIYRHLHTAIERMQELVRRFPNESGLKQRALAQALREVMLSQASDWPFIMHAGTVVSYAKRRIREHVSNFTHIYESLSRGVVGTEWLTRVERKNNIFPNIDYRLYAERKSGPPA